MTVRNSLHRQRAHYVKNKPNLVTNSLHVCWGLLSYKYANIILRLACCCNNIYIEIGARRPPLAARPWTLTIIILFKHPFYIRLVVHNGLTLLSVFDKPPTNRIHVDILLVYILWKAVWTSFSSVFVILVNTSHGFKVPSRQTQELYVLMLTAFTMEANKKCVMMPFTLCNMSRQQEKPFSNGMTVKSFLFNPISGITLVLQKDK